MGSEHGGDCEGRTDLVHDLVAGRCMCKRLVVGRRCDTCMDGYWNMRADNPDGCEGQMFISFIYCFYGSTTVEKRRRRHTVFRSVRLWVSECVSLWVPKTLWTPYLKSQWREFHSISVTDVLGFIDVLTSFWGSKFQGQGHQRSRTQKPCEHQWRKFHPIYLGL